MYIKPLNDKKIPDPIRGGHLPADGGIVDDNDMYWQRRIQDGDVEIVAPEVVGAEIKNPAK